MTVVSTLAPRARRRLTPPPPPDPVTQYALDVVAGRIVAGKLVRKACERHLRDLSDGGARGLRFDVDEAERAIAFFGLLRHYKGEWGPRPGKPQGDPITLASWQKFLVGAAFGWKRADGTRRFRSVYLEVAKKNGKTLIAAVIGILLAFFDGEPAAEVYSVATKRDQAKLSWTDAVQMVKRNTELARRLSTLALTITDLKSASFFRPLGRDSDSDQGINPHGAIVDELHVLEDRDSIDNIETATSARRQPMVVKITTAGVKRESVWAEERADAVAVVEGRATDDAMLVLIYTLDDTSVESYGSSQALRWMIQSCTCRSRDTANTRSSAAPTPSARRSVWDSATAAIDERSETGIQRFAGSRTSTVADGRMDTESRSEPLNAAGRRDTRATSSKETASQSSGSQPSSTTGWSSSRVADAPSAEDDQTDSASTTITTRESFEGFSAVSATARSGSSETVRQAYSEHSPTCAVRSSSALQGDGLRVTIEGDDPFDEAVWPKANPNLGVSVNVDTLREQAEKAKRSPGKLAAFLRFRMNVPTNVGTRAINIDEWDLNAGVVVEPDGTEREWTAADVPRGTAGYAGLDLASVQDLTALIAEFRSPDGFYDVLCWFWCPEDGIAERSKRDGVPYEDWVRDGFLIATPGKVTDYAFIREAVKTIGEQYLLSEIAYDKWNATQLVTELEQDGAMCVPIPQTHAGLGPAWRELDKLILEHRYRHGGHPILRWMAGNVEVETDAAGNQKPSKRLSNERIDGMVALDMAQNRWMANGEVGIWSAA